MSHDIDNQTTEPRMAGMRAQPVARRRAAVGSVRRFSHVLLATLLSTLIVVADRMVDAWTSGGLVLALVALWLAIFGGLVLFSRFSGRLALWLAGAWQDLTSEPDSLAADRQPG